MTNNPNAPENDNDGVLPQQRFILPDGVKPKPRTRLGRICAFLCVCGVTGAIAMPHTFCVIALAAATGLGIKGCEWLVHQPGAGGNMQSEPLVLVMPSGANPFNPASISGQYNCQFLQIQGSLLSNTDPTNQGVTITPSGVELDLRQVPQAGWAVEVQTASGQPVVVGSLSCGSFRLSPDTAIITPAGDCRLSVTTGVAASQRTR